MLKTSINQYWIFDFERGQYGNNVKNIIKQTCTMDSPAYTVLLEPGTIGGAAGLLYNEYKEALKGFNTIQSEPKGTKADRATPLANAIYDGKVHVCINDNDKRELFLQEFKSFPNGKHDDIVDAYAHAFNYLSSTGENIIQTAGQRKRVRL